MGYLQTKFGPKQSLEHQVTIEIQFWSLDHKLGAIWSLDLFITIEIQFWLSDQHERDMVRQITLERGLIFHKISAIYHRFFGDFLRKIGLSIYLHEMSCHLPLICDILMIYRRYFVIFSFLLMTFKTKSPLYGGLGFTRFLNAQVIFL